jgi:hypothetical protein
MSLTFATAELSGDEFQQRRDQARRSGSPAWLWPEVRVNDWSAAMAHLSTVVTAILGGERAALPPIEPMALSLACYTSGAGPLLGVWLETGQLTAPDDAGELLALHLEHARRRATLVDGQSRQIVAALADCGVPVVVLKGAHTAYSYFPDPATRPSSDLDLLVPRDSSAQAEVALAKAGLEIVGRSKRESTWMPRDAAREPRSLWLVHAENPWSVDLHSSLDLSASAGAPLVRFDFAEPIETSRPWPLDDSAGVLSQPLLLLYLAVHAGGGLQSLTLLRMIEIVLVARCDSQGGSLSWDEFLHLGAATNALGVAYPALSMTEKLSPGTIPSRVLEICAELAPRRAHAVLDKLDPATAQRVDRASVAEHFMWVSGVSGWARQLAYDLAPRSDFWPIYKARFHRLLRGQISR